MKEKAMKFWQLVSVVSADINLISDVASKNIKWKKYEALASNFSTLVKIQDRTALDYPVEEDFIVAVLGEVPTNLYLSSDNWLRSWQLHPTDQPISVLDSFFRYGPDLIESVFERGAAEIC